MLAAIRGLSRHMHAFDTLRYTLLPVTRHPEPPFREDSSAMSEEQPVVLTDGLIKHYGRIQALKGVSVRVNPGEVYGLLGQNGAGKTTLVKVLLGIARKTAGDANL